jgi:hypothetical protein
MSAGQLKRAKFIFEDDSTKLCKKGPNRIVPLELRTYD